MQINKDLELPFEYSWNLVKFLLAFVILIIVGLIIYKFLQDKIKRISQRITLPYVKSWYIRKLQNLLLAVTNNKIELREAYLQLSNIIRNFIAKATGINVLNLSKKEIAALRMDNLSTLMEEYYPPEFSKYSTGDIISSIRKAMDVIQVWK